MELKEIINALERIEATLALREDGEGFKCDPIILFQEPSRLLMEDIDKLQELMFLIRSNQVEIIKTKPNTISFENAPEEWADRCSGDGHKRSTNKNGDKVYQDSGQIVQEEGIRPCAKCGNFPNKNGDDACIQNLGSVINACCGHGVNDGYIMFDDGRILEGKFTVKNLWNNDTEEI